MTKPLLDGNRINEILISVLDTIEGSKNEIFIITEKVRDEYERTKQELEDLKARAINVISEVDVLEEMEKKSRYRLLFVSRNFDNHSEDDIKKAYEEANDLRIKLILKRQEEKLLIEKRKNLEFRLKDLLDTLKRAEKLATQISIAIGYLSGNLNNIIDTIGDMNKKQYLGIKIIEAQEEERQRVARDIHDGPAQSLANLALNVELCEKLLSIDIERTKKELNKLKKIVRDNLKDVRKIIYDLRPMSLDDLGLIPTVQRYVSVFSEETGLSADVKIFSSVRKLNTIIEIAGFRIIQEALNNIRKHSRARNVKIKIEFKNNNLNIMISDDGVGFDTEQTLEDNNSFSGGFGFIGMKERAELLGGNLKVISSVGKGTKVILTIPINGKDELNERQNQSINSR